jgi:ribosomal protein L37AE/L43A
MITLYPDQEEFIGEIRKLWKNHKRIVGVMPTGGGKTRCAAFIIKGCVDKGLRVCFVVPRISLIEQTARLFADLGLTGITYIWAGEETSHNAPIAIASLDTLIRRDKSNYDLFIIDEVHHRRKALLEWMERYPNDRYLGFTATPFGDFLGTYYSAMAKSKPMWWMIENKRLSPYEVFSVSKPDLSRCKITNTSLGRDYAESDIAEIMGGYKLCGDVVSNWMENADNRLTMALCVNKAHAGHLTNEFNRHGVAAELITADTPVEERQQIFSRAKSGVTRIILSINCLTEGFDMPECEVLINARPVKSKARFIQGVGRILRYIEGKVATIYDHAGSFIDPDLGFVEYIEINELGSGSDGLNESQRVLKEIEKIEKAPKECPKCKFVKPVGMFECGKCGFKPTFGEDVDVDTTRKLVSLRESIHKPDKHTKENKQLFWSELKGWQLERAAAGKPVKDGFLSHKYRERFQVWPKGMNNTAKVPSPETRNWLKSQQIRYAKGISRK